MHMRKQGVTLYSAACVIIGMHVVIQLWLLSTSMDELFAGDAKSGARAALASALLCAANAGLLWYVLRFDRRLRRVTGE